MEFGAERQLSGGRPAPAAEQQAGQAIPFDDPGEAGRAAAQKQLESARSRLDSVGDRASDSVGAVRDKAPKKPSLWSKVGNFFSDVGAGLENAGGHLVNGLASFGNAVANHPGAVGTAAAGAGLMLLGGAGEIGGVALDLTGVGIIPGAAVNVASTAVIGIGGGMVAGGTADLMMHTTGDDSVSAARTDHTGSGGDEGFEPDDDFRGSGFSKDEIAEFINGHTGDGDPTADRPTLQQIHERWTMPIQ